MTLRPEHLGTDAVGRGAGWRKTNNAATVAMALNDCMVTAGMSGGELIGALVENVIAAIQASTPAVEWRNAGHAVATLIERRMVVR